MPCVFFVEVLLAVYRSACTIKGKSKVKVNCWFCSEDSTVKAEERNQWTCISCGQYNGFTEEGDYNQPIQAQYDLKDHRTKPVCSPSHFDVAKSVLCDSCNQNQVLKVRQLAAFVPFIEENYDEEVYMYKDYLENVYNLCKTCQERVSEQLKYQNSKLLSSMSEAHLRLLDELEAKSHSVPTDPEMITKNEDPRSPRPGLPLILFALSSLAASVYFICNLRLYVSSETFDTASGYGAYLKQGFKSVVMKVVPARFAINGEMLAVFVGAALCVCGLVVAGKYSLYPEDAVHLLSWLVSMVTTSDVFTSSLPWVHPSRGTAVFISFLTLSVSVLCCLKSRYPRHFTAFTIQKRVISGLKPSNKSSSDCTDGNSYDENSDREENVEVSSTHSGLEKPTHNYREEKGPVFEDVRQDLESINLGLRKKSGSSSSIWSLPAIIASSTGSEMTPDSSSDEPSHSSQQPRSLLSPSRLGFLNYDPTQENQPALSRSPSPWFSQSSSVEPPVAASQVVPQMRQRTSLPYSQAPTQGLIKPVAQKSQQCDQPSVRQSQYSHLYSTSAINSLSRVPEEAVGPCDSQSSEGVYTQYTHSAAGQSAAFPKENMTGSSQNWRNVPVNSSDHLYTAYRTPETQLFASDQQNFKEKTDSETKYNSKNPRRSQRIANVGKSPKPWPLKKSLSCNNAYDRENIEKAGAAARRQKNMETATQSFSETNISHSIQPQVPDFVGLSKPRNDYEGMAGILGRRGDLQGASNSNRKHNVYGRREISEFSDDEGDETVDQRWFTRSKRNRSGRKDDISWQWIFLGLVIGISVTSNIFLTCQSWTAKQGGS